MTTDRNINKLQSLTDNVTLLFDNDKAGRNAAKRSYVASLQSELNMSVSTISSGKDPDEFLMNHSLDEFYKDILNKKLDLNYFINSSYMNNLADLSCKNSAILEWRKDILPGILSMDDIMRRNFELRNSSLIFQTPLTDLLESHHYKFLSTAFLTKEEIEKRDLFYKKEQVNKEFKNKFDNTLNSKNRITNLFRAEELRKGLIFEMNKIGIMDDSKESIEKFIFNNKSICDRIKNDVEYNEMLILHKIENKYMIDVYKHLNEFYHGLSPQEIYAKLFAQISHKEKEKSLEEEKLSPFFQFEKLKNALNSGKLLSNEIQSFKETEVDFLILKFSHGQIDLLNSKEFNSIQEKINFIEDSITIEEFDKYLHFIRLPEEKNSQELFQNKIKNEIDLLQNNANRKRVLAFEEELKTFIADKLEDKHNVRYVFNEVRNILMKESLHLDKDEKNSHKAYMNFAEQKNIFIFKDIIKDIDLHKIEKILNLNALVNQKSYLGEWQNKDNSIVRSIFEKEIIAFHKEESVDDIFTSLSQKSGIQSSYNNKNSLFNNNDDKISIHLKNSGISF